MDTGALEERLTEAKEAVVARYGQAPKVAVVLGSGLGAFAEAMTDSTKIPYSEIPHMPSPKVQGHAGYLWLGKVAGVEVACLQGRVHLYEGHSPQQAVFGVRLLARLGCFAALLTNAAGGLRPSFDPGSLMVLSDHLNLTGQNPLTGPNEETLGPRFPDMTRSYDPRLSKLARDAAAAQGLRLEEGIYAAMAGPTYETPAEIRMLRMLGADAVGMSTVPEVIALRHMGIRVAAMSCITNMGAGMTSALLDHSEVERTARATRDAFVKLLTGWISAIGKADWAPQS